MYSCVIHLHSLSFLCSALRFSICLLRCVSGTQNSLLVVKYDGCVLCAITLAITPYVCAHERHLHLTHAHLVPLTPHPLYPLHLPAHLALCFRGRSRFSLPLSTLFSFHGSHNSRFVMFACLCTLALFLFGTARFISGSCKDGLAHLPHLSAHLAHHRPHLTPSCVIRITSAALSALRCRFIAWMEHARRLLHSHIMRVAHLFSLCSGRVFFFFALAHVCASHASRARLFFNRHSLGAPAHGRTLMACLFSRSLNAVAPSRLGAYRRLAPFPLTVLTICADCCASFCAHTRHGASSARMFSASLTRRTARIASSRAHSRAARCSRRSHSPHLSRTFYTTAAERQPRAASLARTCRLCCLWYIAHLWLHIASR